MRITKKCKNILSIGLAVLVLFGAVGAVASFATNDTKTIGFSEFEIGSLNEVDGQYKEDKTAIYTKDVFECQGLKVKPEFDSDVTYQIFWYNEDELYLDCTQKTTIKSAQFVGSTPELARYARIVIFPSQLDKDGKQIKDFKVSIFDIPTIVKNLKITVNKEQEFDYNLIDSLSVYDSSKGTKAEVITSAGNIIFPNTSILDYFVSMNEFKFSSHDQASIIKLDCANYSSYRFFVPDGAYSQICFYTSSGTYVSQYSCHSGVNIVEVPDTSADLVILAYLDFKDGFELRPYMIR